MSEKKKVLFVINTLGQGGAESAFVQFIKKFDPELYEMHLYVIMGQGNLIRNVPTYVRLLNRNYDPSDLLSARGKRRLALRTLRLLAGNMAVFKDLGFLVRNFAVMKKVGRRNPERLLWQVLTDGSPAPNETYDLAVAYLEGAATYYVARKVTAKRKAAFIHTDYKRSCYSPSLDRGAYDAIDRIYCVSETTRTTFLSVYPEHKDKTFLFYNIIDRSSVLAKARLPCSFDDDGYEGLRIVSVGRLVRMKGVDKSIRAMRLLKERGIEARWYTFGEGDARHYFEKTIDDNGVRDCFFMPGSVDNPYPYLKRADIYCQCSDYEGRSLAISEALMLGCPVVASDLPGNSEQVTNGVNGFLVNPDPVSIADAIMRLAKDKSLRTELGRNASHQMLQEYGSRSLPPFLKLSDQM
jgi:glycosyltransferase involved in cell wall biosynthesis